MCGRKLLINEGKAETEYGERIGPTSSRPPSLSLVTTSSQYVEKYTKSVVCLLCLSLNYLKRASTRVLYMQGKTAGIAKKDRLCFRIHEGLVALQEYALPIF
jgi:hypothetical protein